MNTDKSTPPSLQAIESVLNYCPETGTFTRKTKTSNSVRVGQIAGYVNSKGYRQIKVCGNRYYASRLAWLFVHGEWPDGQIDHLNHVRNDDRIENLRVVDSQQNCTNRSLSSNNVSGVTGVHWLKSRQCWRANITVNAKRIHLYQGKFVDRAIQARKAAEQKYGFHVNHGRDRCAYE